MNSRGQTGTLDFDSILDFFESKVGMEYLGVYNPTKGQFDSDLIKLADFILEGKGDEAENLICRKLFLSMMTHRAELYEKKNT